ncbi:MAG: Gfo/Idh/MocA family oxidoreductase [Planctomycetes bacterium]|nr:Gfo/Idh/MocA family oxidoreductase [Planctomycetota bacterium]
MNTAIIGCGYVADFYATNARAHPDVAIAGAYDASPERAKAFGAHFDVATYESLDAVLADGSVELVLNLTNPRSHLEVTRACLEAGKHVYSEKPLAMDLDGARSLAALAAERGVRLGSAPCSVLSNPAQTAWKAIRDGAIGPVRLVYASFDEGLDAPRRRPWTWTSVSGAPWPAQDEFEVGCTFEHAGYVLTWLAAFFGPARRVTSFSSCLAADKGIAVDAMAPDFSVGCLEYDGGIVARVTCGLTAPRDKSLVVVGDDGILVLNDLRDEREPVYIRRESATGAVGRAERALRWLQARTRPLTGWVPWPRAPWTLHRRLPDALGTPVHPAGRGKPVDFLRGVQDMVDAIRKDRPHRLSAELGVHLVELIDALQFPERGGHHRAIETTFPAIPPLPAGG